MLADMPDVPDLADYIDKKFKVYFAELNKHYKVTPALNGYKVGYLHVRVMCQKAFNKDRHMPTNEELGLKYVNGVPDYMRLPSFTFPEESRMFQESKLSPEERDIMKSLREAMWQYDKAGGK